MIGRLWAIFRVLAKLGAEFGLEIAWSAPRAACARRWRGCRPCSHVLDVADGDDLDAAIGHVRLQAAARRQPRQFLGTFALDLRAVAAEAVEHDDALERLGQRRGCRRSRGSACGTISASAMRWPVNPGGDPFGSTKTICCSMNSLIVAVSGETPSLAISAWISASVAVGFSAGRLGAHHGVPRHLAAEEALQSSRSARLAG